MTSFLLPSLASHPGSPWGVQYTKVGSGVYFLLLPQHKTNTLVPWNTVYYHIAQEEKMWWTCLISILHGWSWHHILQSMAFRLLGSELDSIQCGCRTDRAISHLHIGWSSCSPFKAYLAWSSCYFQCMQKWNCTSCMAFNFLSLLQLWFQPGSFLLLNAFCDD